MIADSNLIIYSRDPKYPNILAWLTTVRPAISVITKVEILGFRGISTGLLADYQALLQNLIIHPVNDAVIDKAIEVRQQKRIAVADALIAATALVHGVPLATANEADYANIPGLHVVNPLRP